jgi:nucleotide-binding universal stress UspA family protein
MAESASAVTTAKSGKLLWAVDPTQNPAEAKNLVKEVKAWSKHLNCEVLPIAMYSKTMTNLPIKMPYPWDEEFEERARKSLARHLKKANASGFLPPELLFVPWVSTRKMAFALAKYAQAKKAKMIFVNTRARKSWNPFRLGGFAETLVTTSRTPVLLMNPAALPSGEIQKILFPTDFSVYSRRALELLKPWAKAMGAKVLFFNQIEFPTVYPSEFASGLPVADAEGLVDEIELARIKHGSDWQELLNRAEVESSTIIQRQRKYLTAEVLDAAKKNRVNLIAMASESGPFVQAILGSTARDVLLKAKCPVLVFFRPRVVREYETLGPKTKLPKEFMPFIEEPQAH